MSEVIFSLLVWLSGATGYIVPDALPQVEYRSPVELKRMGFCVEGKECDDEKLPKIDIVALFEWDSEVIYLRGGFDPTDMNQQGNLVHELMHFLQGRNGRRHLCQGLLEREAYTIENQWRKENGLSEIQFNPAIMVAMSCLPGPT